MSGQLLAPHWMRTSTLLDLLVLENRIRQDQTPLVQAPAQGRWWVDGAAISAGAVRDAPFEATWSLDDPRSAPPAP